MVTEETCARERLLTSACQLVPQRPSQNLPDVRLRELGPEVDVLRHLVAGERFPAVLDDLLLGEVRVLAHDEERDDFTGTLIGLGDGGGFQDSGMLDGDRFDLVRVYVEA